MSQLKEIFFDLETQRLSDEVEGGWSSIAKFGLSVAVTWDDKNGFRKWLEGDASELVKELERADKVIGFNIVRFDYEVLRAYVPNIHELLDKKTFDILIDLEARLGFRPSLEHICLATLDKGKLGSGKDAVEWFRSGQVEKVVLYCQRDVDLTRDVYRYGKENELVYYARMGEPVKVEVDWGR